MIAPRWGGRRRDRRWGSLRRYFAGAALRGPAAHHLAALGQARSATPSPSSTGWPPPASPGGRFCRWARPTAGAPPTAPARPSRAGRGLLEHPGAPVSSAEEADFRARERYWIGDWERAARGRRDGRPAGRRAVRDQVRFEREWRALRAYAAAAGVRLIGDVPLYVAPGSVDRRSHPRCSPTDFLAGAPPDEFNATGQLWGNPIYRLARDATRGLPLVGRAPAPRRRAVRPRAAWTTSAAWSPTGRCPPGRATRAPGRWRRGPRRRAAARRPRGARGACR